MFSFSDRFDLLKFELNLGEYKQLKPKYLKAMNMTHEQPNIFYRVENDGSTLIGVVKSQTNNNLVYASYIRSDGSYGCQTQKLNSCGGLRGSVCKHIITLITTSAYNRVIMKRFVNWIKNSITQRPNNIKDLSVYIFEQYENRIGERILGTPINNNFPRVRYRAIQHRDNFPIPSTIKIIDSLIEGEVELKTDGNIQNKVNTVTCIGTRIKILFKDAENSHWKCCSGCGQWFSPDAQQDFSYGADCPSSLLGLANKHTIKY